VDSVESIWGGDVDQHCPERGAYSPFWNDWRGVCDSTIELGVERDLGLRSVGEAWGEHDSVGIFPELIPN
jgi:hypothetical protein